MVADTLRICLLTYRGNPTCGGQGVYIKHLSRALRDLGHTVDVFSGPPYPELPEGVGLHKIPSLDLYNPDHLFKIKKFGVLKSPINQIEFATMCLGGFPEPLTFGFRTFSYFLKKRPLYDIVHDNQSLSYGLFGLRRLGYPVTTTIHHPITVDRDEELKAAKSLLKKFQVLRWYSFIKMQRRVARRLDPIITVSEASKRDLSRVFTIPESRFRVVPNGINTEYFYPDLNAKRPENHILVTNSADTPLKGLKYLLHAISSIRKKRNICLTVIGAPKKDSDVGRLIKNLGIEDCVTFTGRINNDDFVRYYSQSTMAVVPSLYEGFGMPAAEAMACGVPVISTSGGALPEVVGNAGIIVPPGDSKSLENAILSLLDDPERRQKLGALGIERVKRFFTWEYAAKKIVNIYKETIHANGRSR